VTAIQTTLQRETAGRYRGDALVVELHSRFLAMRAKGKRLRFQMDWESLYDYLQKRDALIKMQARRAARRVSPQAR